MKRGQCLIRADHAVNGERDQQYGDPGKNFERIAEYWGTYLGTQIGPEDVAIMMMLVKIARLEGSEYKHKDSWVDIAGYAACGCEIATEGAEE